jgi:hypothetical protein
VIKSNIGVTGVQTAFKQPVAAARLALSTGVRPAFDLSFVTMRAILVSTSDLRVISASPTSASSPTSTWSSPTSTWSANAADQYPVNYFAEQHCFADQVS